MPALEYSISPGEMVYVNHPMPYGAATEIWIVDSCDACHYYVKARYTPGPTVRVRFDSVRRIDEGR